MKKILSVLAATAVLTVATGAMAGIVTSKHNLSSGNGLPERGQTNQICVYCHTPHNSVMTRALWNRNNPTASFKLYTSGVIKEDDSWYATGSSRTLDPNSPSILCMSCHDGTTGVNAAVATAPIGLDDTRPSSIPLNTGFGATDFVAGKAALGTNLTNDHPINIIYSKAVAASGTLAPADGSNKVGGVLPLAKEIYLECNTCHNVHDNTYVPFLRVSMENSKLCTTCHLK
ncbi:cytochrome c3 family protein [Geotalea sp. SG265]|uniref:cytochrome c3 family protein n=1 Tax=Geotalea sp. SG265 TaxID=2922867 RepID=UPI001FAF8128|nr:cytochrome c3 family protein [Geotalea sp. SG265]